MGTIDDWIKKNPIPTPDGYDYEDLKPEDKEFIRGMIYVLMDRIENYDPDICESDGTIGKIKSEIIEEAIEDLANLVMIDIAEMIVSIMENDEDYWEKDPEEEDNDRDL